MEKTKIIRVFRMLLCLVVIAGTIAALTACGNKRTAESGKKDDVIVTDNKPAKSIVFTVTDDKGEKTDHSVKTKAVYLKGALDELELIEGVNDPAGFYVTVVDGLEADYDKDGAYWAFYKDGEYLMTGVAETEIADGDHYEISYTK